MQTALYKAYFDDELVYVGVSKSALRRLSEHGWAKPTSVMIEQFASREEAEAEERRLIRKNNPVYNVAHNLINQRKRSERLRRKSHRGDAAEIVKRARRLAALTQSELAAKLGIHQQGISAYETGRNDPTLTTLQILLAACGLEMRIQLEPIGKPSQQQSPAGAPAEVPRSEIADD